MQPDLSGPDAPEEEPEHDVDQQEHGDEDEHQHAVDGHTAAAEEVAVDATGVEGADPVGGQVLPEYVDAVVAEADHRPVERQAAEGHHRCHTQAPEPVYEGEVVPKHGSHAEFGQAEDEAEGENQHPHGPHGAKDVLDRGLLGHVDGAPEEELLSPFHEPGHQGYLALGPGSGGIVEHHPDAAHDVGAALHVLGRPGRCRRQGQSQAQEGREEHEAKASGHAEGVLLQRQKRGRSPGAWLNQTATPWTMVLSRTVARKAREKTAMPQLAR